MVYDHSRRRSGISPPSRYTSTRDGHDSQCIVRIDIGGLVQDPAFTGGAMRPALS